MIYKKYQSLQEDGNIIREEILMKKYLTLAAEIKTLGGLL
jgi:hypothetical protein